MNYFRKTRNVELSTIFYVETQIDANWSNINVVKSFASAYDVAIPVVCIMLDDTIFKRKEVGATTLENNYGIIVDIFARSDGQRLDLADFIMEEIKGSWIYYTHSQSGGVLSRGDSGTRIQLREITLNKKIEIGENPEQQDRFRHRISFIVSKF